METTSKYILNKHERWRVVRWTRAKRRALSPLVSTIVLISAAIVGGIIVYNYFQNNVNTIAASSGALQVSASATYLNAQTKLVHVELVNTYSKPVNVTGVTVVLADGTQKSVTLSQPQTVAAGSKATFIVDVPASAKILYVDYTYNGQSMESSAVQIG
jgi:hypothetical protein